MWLQLTKVYQFSRAWVIAEMVQADIIQVQSTKLKQSFCASSEESPDLLTKKKVKLMNLRQKYENKNMILDNVYFFDVDVINKK